MRTLGTRELNRALLARQSLLRRQSGSALQLIEHLVGMQAQAPFPPYYGLWTRLRGFRTDELSQLLFDRKVARIVVMRGTVHLVAASDALPLRTLTQPIMETDLRGNTTFTPKLAGVDLDELAATARESLLAAPLNTAALGEALSRRWPDHDPKALVYAARNRLPLVQVPPRGVWGRSGRPTYATADSWLRQAPRRDLDLAGVVLRYLAAFGPATVRDVQTWCGLTRLGEVVERLRPRLRTFRDEDGRELFDLPEAPRPDADTPAPPRFVPEFDNLLFSHADRTRVLSDEDRQRIKTKNAVAPGVFLVDGFVSGRWKLRQSVLEVEPFRPLSKRNSTAIEAEGRRLLRFAGKPEGQVRLGSATR
ncbi:hypothetical protein SacmaDRAFT_0393 [Saccharomonospora marina XMU15]|uniref:Winged helix DNA-binding domain-containing protein n=1 Tax=Saccharomonospora marina XMU15 TaxID=882083 RepID=H5X2A3_9PSEU|nr:winged helix DNA-binding domain-containing protein [Saccharomonospora marina]EHR48699.1 hypothetical protein SacmaDRAFT_0393 [Saccharomonospora marina XMU15]